MTPTASDLSDADLAVLRRLLDDPAAVVDAATFLEKGWTHRNFRVRVADKDYALRVCREDNDAAGREAELALLRGPAASLAPTLRGFLLPEGHLLTDFVEGPLWMDAEVTPRDVATLARRVHVSLGQTGRSYDALARIEADLIRAEKSGVAPAPEARTALALGSPELEATTGCHNDFNPWNVIAGPTGWVLVDWETAADNHPLFDLVCMVENLGWDPDRLCATVAYYFDALDAGPPTADEILGYRRIFWLGSYSWAFAERSCGNPRAELDEQIESSLEALRNL